jgi:hypothetical protein
MGKDHHLPSPLKTTERGLHVRGAKYPVGSPACHPIVFHMHLPFGEYMTFRSVLVLPVLNTDNTQREENRNRKKTVLD